MRTNCELPLCMLDENNELNDLDFVLFHLIKTNPTYRQWVYDQRRLHPERTMILDNSAYEFFVKGETLDLDEYVELVNDLQPMSISLRRRMFLILNRWLLFKAIRIVNSHNVCLIM